MTVFSLANAAWFIHDLQYDGWL